MKALTDKIRQKLQVLASECEPNSEYSKGIQQAIITIEWEEGQAEFEEVARIMMKHLGDGNKMKNNLKKHLQKFADTKYLRIFVV